MKLTPEAEAAWLHHEFVRIHPFQDGNGRMSRMLMSIPFIKAGEFPAIILAHNKKEHILSLEATDAGYFRVLVNYSQRPTVATTLADLILKGKTDYHHGNDGFTSNGIYHPPGK